ncbi:hypothetical protein J6590_064933 [Homalodisca vitripennis]|nr:hypothetical protein J6590_064933 [Homalodisca vitripennis]
MAEQVPTRFADKEVAQLSCSARMSYHSVRSSRTGHRSVVWPSKFQLVLQMKSLSSVAALVCPITRYVQSDCRSVVWPSKFQLVLQIRSRSAQLQRSYVLSSVRSSRTGHRSVVWPSKFQLVLRRKSLSSVAALVCLSLDKEVAQLSCSARMSYHLVRSSQTGHRSVVSPSKFQLVLQIRKSLSSDAAPVCPITWYVQVGLAIEA